MNIHFGETKELCESSFALCYECGLYTINSFEKAWLYLYITNFVLLVVCLESSPKFGLVTRKNGLYRCVCGLWCPLNIIWFSECRRRVLILLIFRIIHRGLLDIFLIYRNLLLLLTIGVVLSKCNSLSLMNLVLGTPTRRIEQALFM